jgi:hypothetical protein
VTYRPLTSEQEREQLLSFGLDEGTAGFMVALNADLGDGAMAPNPRRPGTPRRPPHRTAGHNPEDMDLIHRACNTTKPGREQTP